MTGYVERIIRGKCVQFFTKTLGRPVNGWEDNMSCKERQNYDLAALLTTKEPCSRIVQDAAWTPESV